MAKPLTKCTESGTRYFRPPTIESEIDAALAQHRDTLARRAAVEDQTAPGFLPSEALVHLVREARRQDDFAMMNVLLPHLLKRCATSLIRALRDDRAPNAEYLREEALGRFAVLFAEDGTGDNPDELDFFEVRFNKAFAALRTDLVRHESTRVRHERPLPDAPDDPDPTSEEDDAFARLPNAVFLNPATQQKSLLHAELLAAINVLPPNERAAVALVHILGYDEESKDPTKRTAATICGVTGRTIRNYLQRAAKKLSRFEEKV